MAPITFNTSKPTAAVIEPGRSGRQPTSTLGRALAAHRNRPVLTATPAIRLRGARKPGRNWRTVVTANEAAKRAPAPASQSSPKTLSFMPRPVTCHAEL